MGGGANGGQGMTPPSDAGGTAGTTNGNPPTPPANADGSTTPPSGDQNGQQSGARPEKPSNENGQQGGKPTNRESALGIEKGSVITVQDADGRTLYTATALGSMSSVIFSSSDIKEGETYTVLVDGASVGTATAKLGTSSSSAAARWARIRTAISRAVISRAAFPAFRMSVRMTGSPDAVST